MRVYTSKAELSTFIIKQNTTPFSLGFVPTMGALHAGHLSLVKAALDQNTLVVVSIFVNPTQFDNPSDLRSYSRTLTEDVQLLETLSETQILVYAPTVSDVYGSEMHAEHFDFEGLEFQMEGKFRTGHFDGVGTIVKRLFEIVKPNVAYFGEKDFQQLQIVKKLVEKNDIPLRVIGCKTYREKDGLAMSSRNTRLTEDHRIAAPFVYKTLKKAKKKFKASSPTEVVKWVKKKFKKHPLLELEYFTIAGEEDLLTITKKENNKKYRAFIAVFAGGIRLIDNIKLKNT